MGIFKKKKTAGITGAAIGFETIGRFRGLRTLFVLSPQDSVAAMRHFLTAKDIQHVHFTVSSYLENQTGQLVILTLAGSGFPITVDAMLGKVEGFATLTPLLKFCNVRIQFVVGLPDATSFLFLTSLRPEYDDIRWHAPNGNDFLLVDLRTAESKKQIKAEGNDDGSN